MSIVTAVVVLLLVVAASMRPTHAFKNGAPAEACAELVPKHGTAFVLQSTTSPYLMDVVRDGQAFNVTLSKSTPSTQPFVGFLIQARINSTDEIVGHFTDPLPKGARYVACNGKPDSTVTHSSNAAKHTMAFRWTTARDVAGVHLIATVAESLKVVWKQSKDLAGL